MGKVAKRCWVLYLLAALAGHCVFAQDNEALSTGEPLAFKNWKDLQVVTAQNSAARVSNRIVLLKAGQVRVEDVVAEFNNVNFNESEQLTARAKKLTSADVLTRLERELARSQKAVEYAKGLTLQEYFLGYISQFQDSSGALESVAGRLSREEVAELIKFLFKNSNSTGLNSSRPNRIKSTFGKLEASAATTY